MRIALLFGVAVLAGCQPAAEPESASEGISIRVGPITSAGELEGIYRVAGLDGIDMADLDRGLSVAISATEIDVLENCVRTHWTYRFEGERLVTTPVQGPTCRRALMPEERAIMDGFDKAERVSRTASNGILFEGPGGSVTLFTQ